MVGRTGGQVGGQVDGWMDRRTGGWVMDRQTNGQMVGWKHEQTDGRTVGWAGGWMDGRPNRWKERWMGGLDGHLGGWMNKKMEAKMDGCYLQL